MTMPVRFRNYVKILVAACLVVSVCLVDADAQTRRKRRARRVTQPAAPKPVITNPTIAPPEATAQTPATSAQQTPATDDVKIISTADAAAQDPASATPAKKPKT